MVIKALLTNKTTMATMVYKYTPEERVVLFFRHIKKELGATSTLQIVQLVGKIVAHIRRGLSATQLTRLVNQLPGIFQIMLGQPESASTPANSCRYSHLDELVEGIYEEDKKSPHSLFSTEVEVLNAVVLVLQKMDKYMNLFSYNVLKYPVVKELQQIPIEDPV